MISKGKRTAKKKLLHYCRGKTGRGEAGKVKKAKGLSSQVQSTCLHFDHLGQLFSWPSWVAMWREDNLAVHKN